MTLSLSPDELLTTTRTVRKRLDFSRPVPREVIQDCIDVAVQAPTGGNRQIWHWMVIGDEDVKSAVADVYRRCWDRTSRNGTLPSYDGADPRAILVFMCDVPFPVVHTIGPKAALPTRCLLMPRPNSDEAWFGLIRSAKS